MDIKIKKENKDGLVRLETAGSIKEVRILEDFMRPGNEAVEICFRGNNSSGIVTLSTKELESLYKQVSDYLHLIRKTKIM
jgi:hypothetical protein